MDAEAQAATSVPDSAVSVPQGGQTAQVDSVEPQSIDSTVGYTPQPSVSLGPSVQQHADSVEASNESGWYLSEGVNGTGEKPDWFIDSKYKNVAEQAKGYKELQRQYSEMQNNIPKAPDQYDIQLREDLQSVELDYEDGVLNRFANKAREMNIPQDAFNALVNEWVEYAVAEDSESALDQQKEMDALGPRAAERLGIIKTWATNKIGPEGYEVFKEHIQTAKDVEMFESLINSSQVSPISPSVNSTAPMVTREDVKQMMADKRYTRDIVYTKKVDAMFRDLADNGRLFS